MADRQYSSEDMTDRQYSSEDMTDRQAAWPEQASTVGRHAPIKTIGKHSGRSCPGLSTSPPPPPPSTRQTISDPPARNYGDTRASKGVSLRACFVFFFLSFFPLSFFFFFSFFPFFHSFFFASFFFLPFFFAPQVSARGWLDSSYLPVHSCWY